MQMIKPIYSVAGLVGIAILLAGCAPKSGGSASSHNVQPPAAAGTMLPDPLAIALVPQTGESKTDAEIRRLQEQVRSGRNPEATLEQLGWEFVRKARESFDPGYYKLAEECALAMARTNGESEAAMLLRGHVLDSLHRFKEAETLARQLVERRGRGFDYGLLGDALMEQGRLDEAVAAYQQMMNLRPDLHAYARAAHVRWLKGDLEGAIEAMSLAAGAATPHDAESAAWVNTRLANYEFQAGHAELTAQLCDIALAFQTNYPPALLLRGKMLLAANHCSEAAGLLRTAAALNPLPEYQWALADALRESGRESEALEVETLLRQRGLASDPRTLALFLATRREAPETALRLGREELAARGDVFTHDAAAWALLSAGQVSEAQAEMSRALAEGTQDARLFFHAAVVAARSGNEAEAKEWAKKSQAIGQMLLPSERRELQALASQLGPASDSAAHQPANPISAF
jgi:tetratricopeptide (TPR) repeat protein